MPEPVAPAQVNTDPAKTGTDVKAGSGETLLGKAATDAAKAATDNGSQGAQPKAGAEVKTDVKAEGTKADGDKKVEGKEAKAEGAPEKYEFKELEGVKLDTEAVSEFEKIAKENNLSNDNAQKFVELASKHTQKIETQMRETQAKAWEDTRKTWVAELKADKEYGGAKFDETKELALRAVRFVNVPGLNEVFDSGWGDNPKLVTAFAKFGKALSEDKLVDGDASSSPKSAAEIIYGKK
jgi:hypothetical protein